MKTIIYEFVCEDNLSEDALNTTIHLNLDFIKPVSEINRRADLEEKVKE